MELLRASVFHTPANPFTGPALVSHMDGAVVISGGRIAACGDYPDVRAAHPDAAVTDLRGGFLLPGLIDTHVHFPQVRVLGALGKPLLEWLREDALPEEARMADERYARATARLFLRALAAHGTTSALVFGAHYAAATAALFEEAAAAGLRIASGLVVSDRFLDPSLLQTADAAYRDSADLIRRFHGQGHLRFAVTPRFAVSASGELLAACGSLMREHGGLLFQTHMNENREEVAEVAKLFPGSHDYLEVYERFGLAGPGSVMAHNVLGRPSELERLAATGTAIAHCPSSNAALGSGIFPMRRHLEAGVRFALGTDVGAGTGFGLLKEAMQAYLMQRVAPDGVSLDAARMLYLATRAGAEALGIAGETGDFQPGKAADLLYLRPVTESPLAAVIERAESPERVLSALFTLADAECVREVRVEGAAVYRA